MANVSGFASVYSDPQIGLGVDPGHRVQVAVAVFGMRGWDPGALTYRSWTVQYQPDYAAAAYTGPGAGTLTGVVVAWSRTVLS